MKIQALAALAAALLVTPAVAADAFHTPLPCEASRVMAAPKADRLLVICRGGSSAHLVALPAGTVLRTFTQTDAKHGDVNGSAISDSGDLFALSFLDHTLVVGSDKAAPSELKTDFYLNYLRFAPDGKTLYADNLLIETAPSLRVTRTIPTEFDAVNAVAVSPDGKALVSLAADTTITVYSLPDWKPRVVNRDFATEMYSAAYSPDGRDLVIGAVDGRMLFLNPATLAFKYAVGSLPEMQITGLSPITSTTMLVTYYPWTGGGQNSYGLLDLNASTFKPLNPKAAVNAAAVRQGKIWLYSIHGADLEVSTW